jgi:two-component system, NtrC family, sensor kinase
VKRRAGTGRTKARRPKLAGAGRGGEASPAQPRRSANDLNKTIERLRRELEEAREQQAAASEVLKIISSSPGELEPVFQAMLANATRICEANFGNLVLFEGDAFRRAALHNAPQALAEDWQRRRILDRRAAKTLDLIARTRQVLHIVDVAVEYPNDPNVKLAGARTFLLVPMLQEDGLLGVLGIYRQEVRPFTDKQIELVENFAAQAVIAIENARLLGELRQRTDDLSESLEQQTATSDVLKVISSSPGDLKPVFDAMLANATRICGANFGNLLLCEGDTFRVAALHGARPEWVELREREPVTRPGPFSPLRRAVTTRKFQHVEDLRTEQEYVRGEPSIRALVNVAGARSFVAVPMLKDDEPVGIIAIYRQEVHAFTDKQIELVQNFAAQAVIAIENMRLLSELRQRTDDLTESLEQQTATSEVLKVISSSPGDLGPVFRAMLENATRICEANFGVLFLADGDGFRTGAMHNAPEALAEARRREPLYRPPPNTAVGRMARTKQLVQVADIMAEPDYFDVPPGYSQPRTASFAGARTIVAVPMLKDDELVGGFVIYRQEVRSFTDKQIELVQNFAAQAVIAIENARLLSELRQRTDDLTESLEQQTATSEVLKVISSSPGDLEPVFNAMLDNAVRICGAKFGAMYRYEPGGYRPVALHNADPEYAKHRTRDRLLDPPADLPLGQIKITKQPYQVADVKQTKSYLDREPFVVAGVDLGGYRTALGVPMLKDGELVGAITITRQEVAPFSDKQIELVKNFAAQAVIAIENTRLLGELRQRTDDLTESLEQQTATSEVLKVISSSPGELEPVFQAMLRNATQISEAKIGILFRYEDGAYTAVSKLGVTPEYAAFLDRGPIRPGPNTGLGRVASTLQTVHVEDAKAEQVYDDRDPLRVATADLGRARSLLNVPMLKDGQLIGAIGIYRQTVRPFTDKQIELVTNFAAQAVIAIENTRLLSELRQRTDDLSESLEQQTATSEVLKVISSSPGELEPVFDTLLSNATNICGAKFGNLFIHQDGEFNLVAMHNAPPAYAEARKRAPVRPPLGTGLGQVAITKQVAHVTDLMAEQAYVDRHPFAVQGVELGGIRTLLAVPMLKDDLLVGGIVIYRQEVRPFTDKQIELVQNFAAQAVIAIENTRLLSELRQRTDDLSESLEQQTATSEVLKVISSSPGNLEPVFQAMLENATRICDAKFGTMFRYDGKFFNRAAAAGLPPALVEFQQQRGPFGPESANFLAQVLQTKRPLHVEDSALAPNPASRLGGARSIIAVPMLKDGELIGAISIYRQEVRPFTDKQIELVQNFAAQAVIAIENTRLLNELRESLAQQTATADVLKVISRSTFDLQAVLDTLVASAAHLCEADMASVNRQAGSHYRQVASFGYSPEFVEYMEMHPIPAGRGSAVGRATTEGRIVQIDDVLADPEFAFGGAAKIGGIRTILGVPLLREGTPIGVITLQRKTVKPFTEKQIELVQSFADQAVIAIENTRLLSELRESLAQQTATADVLKVISRSTFDLQTVLDTLLASAARLCNADKGFIFRQDGSLYKLSANYGHSLEFAEYALQHPIAPGQGTLTGRVALTGKTVHIDDVLADPEYTALEYQRAGGFRTNLGVPLLKDGTPIGVFTLARPSVDPFTPRQIELVEMFADQAMIAIENVRLFDEVQARTEELAESLAQQTATADVLKVISRSTFDLQTVLDTLTESAARLCQAEMASITRQQGDTYYYATAYGLPPDVADYVKSVPHKPGRGSVFGRTILECKPVHVADVTIDAEYTMTEMQKKGGFRTVLGVPLLREGRPIGVITLLRTAVQPFNHREIELAQTFADQAVIAIENVRLFDEIQDKSHQLEEASRHKSQFLANMSHELRTPLNAIIGYTELILDGIYGETPEKAQATLKRVESNGRHLLGLINDVLDFSKIEAGQLKLAVADYSMRDIVHSVYSAVEPLASKKNLAFKVDVPSEMPVGRGDERKLTQVLLNLVGNAIKFTDAGEVTIKVAPANGLFSVAVHDTGPGIDPANQEKLFEEFQQADNSITKVKGGTGLGLAIARRIIELHGGRLWVDSSLGNGATFTFEIPAVVEPGGLS